MECIQAKEPDRPALFKASLLPLELDVVGHLLADLSIVTVQEASDSMEEAPTIPAQVPMGQPIVGIVLLELVIRTWNMPTMVAAEALPALQAADQTQQSAIAAEAM